MTSEHERIIELLARTAFVLGRVECALPRDLTGGKRKRYAHEIRGWLLGSCVAPGRWATCGMVHAETRIAAARLARGANLVRAARRDLERTSAKGYPPHLRQAVTIEVIALEGDLADVENDIKAVAA